ncbi:MAG: thioredoxin family protein [Candidatus Marinimicrobia bacterium]|jgi:thioredoxin 1|nr:thioredoxin family protein [Candidatus Neomarinimicrobiota bacterium]
MKKKIIIMLSIVILFLLFSCGNQAEKSDTKIVDSVQTAKITFIELGSLNCIPCKMMQPIMKEIEEEFSETVKVVFYDVWTKEGKKYGQQYGIKLIPTQVFLDENGEEFFRHQGFFKKEEIKKLINEQLKK